jgi:hypothetical protein
MFDFLKKTAKSKTVNFNVLVPAVLALAQAFGFEIPKDVAVGILAIGNVILRFFTDRAIKDK